MNETDRKLLTEKMRLCWHDFDENAANETFTRCSKCKKYRSQMKSDYQENHVFNNWADFGLVWEWASKQEWWKDFLKSMSECAMTYEIFNQGIAYHYRFVDKESFPKAIILYGKERLGW